MAYKYVALTSSGHQVSGSVEAPTEEAAERSLWDQGYRIVTLQEAWAAPPLDRILPTIFGTRPREIITFLQRMATLVESGVAVMPTLELLQRQARSALARVLGDIAQAVKEGSSLSEGLARHPQIFPPIFSRMIAVGERTGSIETVLRQLATHMEKEQAIIKRVRGALAYPAFMVLLAVGVVAIIMTAALPPLIALFSDFDAELPLPTRMLIAVTNFVNAYKLHMAAALSLIVAGGAVYVRQPSGQRRLDQLLLRAPLLGPITVMSNASRFSRTVAILFKAGVPLSEVMDLVVQTTPNLLVRGGLQEVREELVRGEGLSKPLASSKLFPPMLVQMVEVGEQTGTLDTNLETMGEFFARETDERIDMLTGLIQPTMTLVVGGIVLFIAVSIIMPMYTIMQSIR